MTFLLFGLSGLVYFFTLTNTVFGGDSGDLVSAIITGGFPHPPGYPLYTILGIFFNHLPINSLSPAGKATLISTLATIFSLTLLWLLIKMIAGKKHFNKFLSLLIILTIGFNYVVWLYAVVPEVFPLNTLIVLLIFYLFLKYYKRGKKQYLYLSLLFLGLGFSHHHLFILIIPSLIYLIYKRKQLMVLNLRQWITSIFFFVVGLLPLYYLVYAYKAGGEIIWGETNTLKGFISVFLRKRYGTFVPGDFITNIPEHRFLQLKNLFLFTKNDFSSFGILLLIFGLIFFFKQKSSLLRTYLTAVLINIFFFGPFFLFYANFPLGSNFLFGTTERFFHPYYFFLSLFLYFGLYQFLLIIKFIINQLVHHPVIKKVSYYLLIGVLVIYPAGFLMKNFPFIYALKNDQTAENLGRDVLNNAKDNSIIILSTDTLLFNTQYVYYSQPRLRKNKIIIHGSKIYFNYYPKVIRQFYPQVRLIKQKKDLNPLEQFIKDNKNRFLIYANQKYPLRKLTDYQWVPQGLLYRLEKKDQVSSVNNQKAINVFWKNAYNKDLNPKETKFKNFFTSDILRVYSIAHQNSGYYFLTIGNLNQAEKHIKRAQHLQPNDPDVFYLWSVLLTKKGFCRKAEISIVNALKKQPLRLYLRQLEEIGKQCFKKEKDKRRVARLLEKYKKQTYLPLPKF